MQVSRLTRTAFVALATLTLTYVAAHVSALEKPRGESGFIVNAPDVVLPLARAHAHNDYEHRRPLFDALSRGFSSVEADVWFSRGRLLVAHQFWQTSQSRTLTSLYLEPLRQRIVRNRGAVYAGSKQSLQLLIDVKTDAEDTYRAIEAELQKYSSFLTAFEGSEVRPGAVTAVLSGNCPRALLAKQGRRFAACDGRLRDAGRRSAASVVPLISEDWGSVFDWRGAGAMPREERSKLRAITRTAHANGQKVRFWSTPDDADSKPRVAVWRELLAAEVDYINTDGLDTLRDFLLRYDRADARPSPWLGAPLSAR